MKDSIFYEMLIEPFTEDFLSILYGILLWVLTILISGIILIGTLFLADSVGLKNEKQGKGIIVDKWFKPAHNTTTYMISGKIFVPITTFHPNKWYAKIIINSTTVNFNVNETEYKKLIINKTLNCVYEKGRISNSIFIKKILFD